jgi:hypothetical protein
MYESFELGKISSCVGKKLEEYPAEESVVLNIYTDVSDAKRISQMVGNIST